MEYIYFKLVALIVVGLGLILFRKRLVKLQKNHAKKDGGLVSKKMNEMSTDHMEKVAIVGGLVALAAATLSIIELLA